MTNETNHTPDLVTLEVTQNSSSYSITVKTDIEANTVTNAQADMLQAMQYMQVLSGMLLSTKPTLDSISQFELLLLATVKSLLKVELVARYYKLLLADDVEVNKVE